MASEDTKSFAQRLSNFGNWLRDHPTWVSLTALVAACGLFWVGGGPISEFTIQRVLEYSLEKEGLLNDAIGADGTAIDRDFSQLSDELIQDTSFAKAAQFAEFSLSFLFGTIVFSAASVLIYIFQMESRRFKKEVTDRKALEKEIRSLRSAVSDATSESNSARGKLDEIFGRLPEPERQERVTIGVFGLLLSYAPIFLAKELGYFKDEGLEVAFAKLGGDDAVASALGKRECSFGVADPIAAVKSQPDAKEDIKVLLPIAKKLDIRPIARTEILNRLDDAEKREKPLRILCFPQPSTSYSTARLLAADFERIGFSNVEICAVKTGDPGFSTPALLDELLRQYDVALLWNPTSSWLFSAKLRHFLPTASKNFGELQTRAENGSLSIRENWRVAGVEEPDRDEKWGPWRPLNQRDDGYKLLATGLLTNGYTLKHRKDLCRRVFRAVTRALIRLEGVDWTIDGDGSAFWTAVENSMPNETRGFVERAALERLVSRNLSGTSANGRSMFPFVDSIEKYDEKTYYDHFVNLISLWQIDNEVAVHLPKINEFDRDGMRKYFVSKSELRGRFA